MLINKKKNTRITHALIYVFKKGNLHTYLRHREGRSKITKIKRLTVGKQAVHAGLLLFAGIAVNIVNCGKAVLTQK